jgi:hypothetical protein
MRRDAPRQTRPSGCGPCADDASARLEVRSAPARSASTRVVDFVLGSRLLLSHKRRRDVRSARGHTWSPAFNDSRRRALRLASPRRSAPRLSARLAQRRPRAHLQRGPQPGLSGLHRLAGCAKRNRLRVDPHAAAPGGAGRHVPPARRRWCRRQEPRRPPSPTCSLAGTGRRNPVSTPVAETPSGPSLEAARADGLYRAVSNGSSRQLARATPAPP